MIKVEGLSKQYRLGNVGTGTVTHDLNRWWYSIRGKENPYLKIGEENGRSTKEISDYVWALKDLNFEVNQGEVLGIIGRNGAGKSTLLKILSRTTTPSTGQVKIKGRVASLLEVGTGFHPELTGRENIFLNGAILGMHKHEIKSKFDEIVDFSGVEKYIDTPVKRYSSGMYVRLAFAVAAYLEQEILIVDEVLAVGDAEFQKKALGKMKDVSKKQGRTVLFVSHNMLALESLCSKCLYLKKGQLVEIGTTNYIINSYMNISSDSITEVSWEEDQAPGNELLSILSAEVDCEGGIEELAIKKPFSIRLNIISKTANELGANLILRGINGDVVFENPTEFLIRGRGYYTLKFHFDPNFLNAGSYTVQLNFLNKRIQVEFVIENLLIFNIGLNKQIDGFNGKLSGYYLPDLKYTIEKRS